MIDKRREADERWLIVKQLTDVGTDGNGLGVDISDDLIEAELEEWRRRMSAGE